MRARSFNLCGINFQSPKKNPTQLRVSETPPVERRRSKPIRSDWGSCAHPLGGTACWAACWSSRTATSARLRPASSWWPSRGCVCTPRSSGAWTAARRALWPAPPPPPPPLMEQRHGTNDRFQSFRQPSKKIIITTITTITNVSVGR